MSTVAEEKKNEEQQSAPTPTQPITLTENTSSQSVQSAISSLKEGSNIHYGNDGKKLCSYSQKMCQQRRMENYAFCIKHILEDPSAPFRQCQFISKTSQKQCTLPVSIKEEEPRYCVAHKQILGIIPRKLKKQKSILSTSAPDILTGLGTPTVTPLKPPKKRLKLGQTDTGNDSEVVSSDDDISDSDSGSDQESLVNIDEEELFISDDFVKYNTMTADETESIDVEDRDELSPEDFLRHRREQILKLIKLYSNQYLKLKDTLRTKYRKYMKKRLRALESGETADSRFPVPTLIECIKEAKHNLIKEGEYESGKSKVIFPTKCTHAGCSAKCLLLSHFCFAHVLDDPNQKLFAPCTYVNPGSTTKCNYPILVGTNPAYCNVHIEVLAKEGKQAASRKRKKEAQETAAPAPGPKLSTVPITISGAVPAGRPPPSGTQPQRPPSFASVPRPGGPFFAQTPTITSGTLSQHTFTISPGMTTIKQTVAPVRPIQTSQVLNGPPRVIPPPQTAIALPRVTISPQIIPPKPQPLQQQQIPQQQLPQQPVPTLPPITQNSLHPPSQ